jgi:hypothetical protein
MVEELAKLEIQQQCIYSTYMYVTLYIFRNLHKTKKASVILSISLEELHILVLKVVSYKILNCLQLFIILKWHNIAAFLHESQSVA